MTVEFIKFTTLFGLLAVDLAVSMAAKNTTLTHILSGLFLLVALTSVWRTFYAMGIEKQSND